MATSENAEIDHGALPNTILAKNSHPLSSVIATCGQSQSIFILSPFVPSFLCKYFSEHQFFLAQAAICSTNQYTQKFNLSIIPPQLSQKDKRSKRRCWDSEDIQTTSNKLLRLKKGGLEGGQCHKNILIY